MQVQHSNMPYKLCKYNIEINLIHPFFMATPSSGQVDYVDVKVRPLKALPCARQTARLEGGKKDPLSLKGTTERNLAIVNTHSKLQVKQVWLSEGYDKRAKGGVHSRY